MKNESSHRRVLAVSGLYQVRTATSEDSLESVKDTFRRLFEIDIPVPQCVLWAQLEEDQPIIPVSAAVADRIDRRNGFGNARRSLPIGAELDAD